MESTPTIRPSSFLSLCALSFTVLASYSIARSISESIFLGHFQSDETLPLAWLAVTVVIIPTVLLYNRLARQLDLVHLFLASLLFSAALLVVLTIAMPFWPRTAAFLLYMWKDIYIVVLLENVFSFANIVFRVPSARRGYGFFLLIGTLGSLSSNMMVSLLTHHVGTAAQLWLILIPFFLAGIAGTTLGRVTGYPGPPRAQEAPKDHRPTWQVLSASSYLLLLLTLIGLVQIAITLVDYEHNAMVQQTFLDENQRTNMISHVYKAVDISTITMQLMVGTLLKWFGVPTVLLLVPAALGLATFGFILRRGFWPIAVAKVASKALDYSLFRAAKEILYIPLSYAEKTRGKALIDMLTYRVAKGGTAVLLFALASMALGRWVSTLTLGVIGCWILATVVIARRYRGLVNRSEERD
ncbi:MAG: hypothetical protein JRH20_13715 [Deltaproteobacteria bacterium]|nr:hypothetical protein [Deltaproteobacteria bacterium]